MIFRFYVLQLLSAVGFFSCHSGVRSFNILLTVGWYLSSDRALAGNEEDAGGQGLLV